MFRCCLNIWLLFYNVIYIYIYIIIYICMQRYKMVEICWNYWFHDWGYCHSHSLDTRNSSLVPCEVSKVKNMWNKFQTRPIISVMSYNPKCVSWFCMIWTGWSRSNRPEAWGLPPKAPHKPPAPALPCRGSNLSRETPTSSEMIYSHEPRQNMHRSGTILNYFKLPKN